MTEGKNLVKIYADSHIGCVREENQDAYAALAVHDGALAVVCDGMGGEAGGRIASGIAVEEFCRRFSSAFESVIGEGEIDEFALHRVCGDAVYAANRAVFDRAVTVPTLQGMGTTLSVAYLVGNRLFVTNVGDSRVYLFHDGALTRISHDDSVVQQMIDAGQLTEQDAHKSECRHLLTRAVGVAPYVEFGFFAQRVEKGDVVLLCSDGLTAHYTDKELQACLAEISDLQKLVYNLIIGTCARGGRDNVTVACLRVE
ncbi:MAG: serine/threonine-protein phosphatase [Clostridia bacterium]|nr:serine/threonine-protein phosphatase [Clostridia bacterium]